MGDLLRAGTVGLDQSVPATALAVGAHPDDIEFGCGATLAKWAAAGCRIHHLILTDGSKGSWDPAADVGALVAARQAECRAAAAIIDGPSATGAGHDDRVLFLGRIDGELENAVDERREVARIIRRLRPAALLGHDPWRRYRLHPDHRAAGFLLLDALVAARDPHFFAELGEEPHRPDSLLLFEADLPNHVEDVSGFESQKVEALLCHRTQFESTMGISPAVVPFGGDGAGGDGAGRAVGGRAVGGRAVGGRAVAGQAMEGADTDEGYATFGAKVRQQLMEHGSLAHRPAGEAFHRITAL